MDLVDIDRSQAVLSDDDQPDPRNGGLEAGLLRPEADLLEMAGHGFQVDVVVSGLAVAAGDSRAVGGGQGAVGSTRGTSQT